MNRWILSLILVRVYVHVLFALHPYMYLYIVHVFYTCVMYTIGVSLIQGVWGGGAVAFVKACTPTTFQRIEHNITL